MPREANNPPQSVEEMGLDVLHKKKNSIYSKKDTLAANEERVRDIVTLAAAGLANVAEGQRKNIRLADTEAVKKVTLDYLQMCVQYSVIPNTAGLAKALGMSRQALYDHMKRHPGDETTEWLKDVSDSFGQILIDCAISGVTAPIPSIFAAKARYGWRETDIEEPYDNSVIERDAEEIADKYDDLPE